MYLSEALRYYPIVVTTPGCPLSARLAWSYFRVCLSEALSVFSYIFLFYGSNYRLQGAALVAVRLHVNNYMWPSAYHVNNYMWPSAYHVNNYMWPSAINT